MSQHCIDPFLYRTGAGRDDRRLRADDRIRADKRECAADIERYVANMGTELEQLKMD